MYRAVAPLVVRLGRGARRGCGLVVARDRVVVLTRSLAREAVEATVDGAVREATVAGHDILAGLSLLEVSTGALEPAPWAPGGLGIGEPVLALGDPGTGLRATDGRVSAAPIEIRGRSGRPLAAVEHTAPLPRGAGGGPLLDESGALAGLNVLRGDPGFVIALAGSTVQAALARLLTGVPQPARLGVAVAPSHVARRLRRAVGLADLEGVLVRDVEPRAPAEIAGLRAGDLIIAFGGTPVRSIDDLLAALDTSGPVAGVAIVRGADEFELEVRLSESGS